MNATVAAAASRPLVVDVDGTLIRTDLLHESALQFVASHPADAWRLPGWLLAGKAALKARLADRVDLDFETIPLRAEVVELIRKAQAQGVPVYLASASDARYVDALARRIGGLAGIFATEGGTNLAGPAKAERLVEAFGAGGFDYVGDAPIDYPVWRAGGSALAVAGPGFERRVLRDFPGARIVARTRNEPRAYAKAMRPHQWAKNLLVFLPMLAGHHFSPAAILAALLAFACFSLAASSAYIVNDLLDLPADREHPRKRGRPFAAATVPIQHGVLLAAALLAMAVAGALAISGEFLGVLAVYMTATLTYSLLLKRKPIVDVIVLGGLYTIRVLGGVVAVGAKQSPWLLMFCLFLFLSLAIVKRCSELVASQARGGGRISGRGYRSDDLGMVSALGAAAGYGAVLVVTLYLASPEVARLYSHPTRMWLICPLLLYWISRILLLAHRGEMHDDPVVFAITDRISWITGALVAVVVALSI